MHVPFHWDAATTYDLRIASETAVEVDLLAADESLIASAEPLPHSDGAAADGAPVEEELVETRLLTEDLDAGFHVLRFRGEPTPLDLLLAARPPGQVQRLAGSNRIGTARLGADEAVLLGGEAALSP